MPLNSLSCYASRSHQYTFTGSRHCHVCAQALAFLCHVSCNRILIAHPALASSPSIWLPLRAFPESPSSLRPSHSLSLASPLRYSMPEKRRVQTAPIELRGPSLDLYSPSHHCLNSLPFSSQPHKRTQSPHSHSPFSHKLKGFCSPM